jgi:hypothetical protein
MPPNTWWLRSAAGRAVEYLSHPRAGRSGLIGRPGLPAGLLGFLDRPLGLMVLAGDAIDHESSEARANPGAPDCVQFEREGTFPADRW